MHQEYCLAGARLVDPLLSRDEIGDLAIRDGKIVAAEALSDAAIRLDLRGKVVAPGFLDLHVHLREPGQTHKEDIVTATRAAAAGGFTTVLAMPNTAPAIDSPEAFREFNSRLPGRAVIEVLQSVALTLGRKGEQVTDIKALKAAGVTTLTDDGSTPQDEKIMRKAMLLAKSCNLPVIDHCEDLSLSKPGVMHAGKISQKLGLPGQPRLAEERIVERDIRLCRETGCRIHLQHLSSGGSVQLLRQARKEGLPVSGEVTPHHLFLTDQAIEKFGTNAKMAPPLREETDRQMLIEALCDGTICAIATDHAPHAPDEKAQSMLQAPFGIIGLEAVVPLCLTLLYHQGLISLPELIARFSSGPRAVLGLPPATLTPGATANLTILDPDHEYLLDTAKFHSKSLNCPWQGIPCKGSVQGVFYQGQCLL
ncbi:MAG: dihydroorotase [Lentisphaeria bacterium]|nr:dihydroorotase [Lentisphaeria bacterium]